MSHVQVVTGILLISAEQKIVQQYFLLKQLYEIRPCLKSFTEPNVITNAINTQKEVITIKDFSEVDFWLTKKIDNSVVVTSEESYDILEEQHETPVNYSVRQVILWNLGREGKQI